MRDSVLVVRSVGIGFVVLSVALMAGLSYTQRGFSRLENQYRREDRLDVWHQTLVNLARNWGIEDRVTDADLIIAVRRAEGRHQVLLMFYVLVGIGILTGREWGRKLSLGAALLSLVFVIRTFMVLLRGSVTPYTIQYSVGLLFLVIVVYRWLSRPSVKAQFR